jgi:hypothetical protein
MDKKRSLLPERKKASVIPNQAAVSSLRIRDSAGIGTMQAGCLPVAGLHWACPSAALDEIERFCKLCLLGIIGGAAGFGQ